MYKHHNVDILFRKVRCIVVKKNALQIKCDIEKSKITKKLNSEENSKRKVPNQVVKSNDKTYQTNGQQLSYP